MYPISLENHDDLQFSKWISMHDKRHQALGWVEIHFLRQHTLAPCVGPFRLITCSLYEKYQSQENGNVPRVTKVTFWLVCSQIAFFVSSQTI